MREKIRIQLKRRIRGKLGDLYWNIYGNTIRNPRWPDYPTSFLFVCRGNICRSPFAENVARKLVGKAGGEERTFYSAGLRVSQPVPPPQEAIRAAESFGVQLNSHRSRKIDQKMVESFDMIFCMEVSQFQTMRKAFPRRKDKVFLLPLFEVRGQNKWRGFFRYNIPDPYGKSSDEFHDCFKRIERCIQGLLEAMQGVSKET